jgi:hypothetical protein
MPAEPCANPLIEYFVADLKSVAMISLAAHITRTGSNQMQTVFERGLRAINDRDNQEGARGD